MELLTSDVGVTVTDKIVTRLTRSVEKRDLADPKIVRSTLRSILLEILSSCERPMLLDNEVGPAMILVIGVNGVGKTTTIGKLTHRFQREGKSVMLAAGDTFRAAAVEQLQVWGQSQDVPVVAQPTGADSASVIFDALESARSKKIDIVIADTAGRLHNKTNLMEELAKVIRVAGKVDPCAPHEVLLVLDATTGQNALSQMAEFETIAGVSGIALTKLDGTAKGGVIFALAEQHKVPVRYIGVGEGIEDLRPFVAKDFVDALLPPITIGNNK
ncbi:MAG: signal recognition particle-docking protein FtsY [Porticoccaceae bacterium]|nr:signal recognition particle-docking protein FtsY [Porticoccaceae bacterium]